MKKAYEVTYKYDNELKTATVNGYTLIGALCKCSNYMNIYEDVVAIKEISFERYHALNPWPDCENECAELCRLAGMESEWSEADGETLGSQQQKNKKP